MAKARQARGASGGSRRAQDITGLLFFFFGSASLLALSWRQPAPLPNLIDNGLRLIAGPGAYAIAVLLLFVGAMFLIGYERLTISPSTFGTLLLFLVFIIWRHIGPLERGASWDSAYAREAGGWVGGLFGTALCGAMGKPISYLFLLMVICAAITMISEHPLLEIARAVWERGRAGARATGRGLQQCARAGSALTPRRRLRQAEPALEGASPAPGGTAPARNAIAPPPARSRPTAAESPIPQSARLRDTALAPSGRLLRMFQLTRPWKASSAEFAEVADVSEVSSGRVAGHSEDPPERQDAGAEPAERTAKSGKSPAEATGQEILPGLLPDAPPEAPPDHFQLPPLTLLTAPSPAARRASNELRDKERVIEETLKQFNIGAEVVEVASGPSVTRYEIQLAPGIKVSKIVSLADNLAMSLAAIDVRVEAPIPGKSAIGVEVPNTHSVTVTLRECLDTELFRNSPSRLTVALGKDVSGEYRYADLTRMPHLLIGGSTNSGKSVCLNALIASLVYRATPREVQLLMIDPKRVELSLWEGLPHLLHPVVKDVRQASSVFRAALKEMDRRYDLFAALGTRNLDGYNQRVPATEQLPYIVLIVDELADLMMQQGPEIEQSICRLAQLARATGIHLVLATQRPSVDIITGTIKANISSRIAFAVASQVDSRTILDMTGADRLIGRGDMLFLPIDASKPIRIQGCYISEAETNALVAYLHEQEAPHYNMSLPDAGPESVSSVRGGGEDDVDSILFEQAVRLVVNNGQASTSMLQRRFRVGYTRAARIVELMEERGIVGPLNGAKPREILISRDEAERMFGPPRTSGSTADDE